MKMQLTLSEKKTQAIIWVLLCIGPLIGMAVDLIAPSLPAISKNLHVSTGMSKAVISIYLLGYAIGNFTTGLATDSIGRQKLLRSALIAFSLASLLPIIFAHPATLLLARLLQGITIGAVSVLIRTISSDILPPEKLVKLGTIMATMWSLGPIVGPVIGGYLQVYFGWQANFYFFAAISLISFIVVYFVIPETHFNRQPFKAKVIKKNIADVLSHRMFIALAFVMGLTYSTIISFNTLGPFLIQHEMHHSPIFFGHLALCLGVAFLIATFTCRYLLKRYDTNKLLHTAVNASLVLTVLSLVLSYFLGNSLPLIIFASVVIYFSCGFIYPMSMGKGMSLFNHIAGTATATMYLINILITSLTGFITSFIYIHSALIVFWVYAILVSLVAIIRKFVLATAE